MRAHTAFTLLSVVWLAVSPATASGHGLTPVPTANTKTPGVTVPNMSP